MTRTRLSPIAIFNKGRDIAVAQGDVAEKAKINTLRGGSSGCITELGEFIGANPWTTLARFMGFQIKHSNATRNIFDNGNANEHLWVDTLSYTDYLIKYEEEYPLTVTGLFPYPLTGRPDAVIGESVGGKFVPIEGVELKAISSSNTAKILTSVTPKTEHLIQSAVYSTFFQLPWTLVYTSSSNYFKLKADKIEFPCHWKGDRFCFRQPDGTEQETVITSQGIKDYYTAICEAFDTKDHSFFRRSNIGWDGQPVNYWDNYNSFLLMVDSEWEWSKWVEYAEAASESDVIITFQSVNKKPLYQLEDVVAGRIVSGHSNLEDARGALYAKIFS